MALAQQFNFTTGPSAMPEVGNLTYNGCRFSPLFASKLSGKAVKDAANRTVKYIEYTLTVDGYVTMPDGNVLAANPAGIGVDRTMRTLRQLLMAQGGALIYQGRGFDLVINTPREAIGIGVGGGGNFAALNAVRDVAWGPVPELLEFQPLGGGLSAKIVWTCTIRVPEFGATLATLGILQLNYDTVVSYDESGYSTLTINGTLEVAITRSPNQSSRELPYTVDDYRRRLEERILTGIDLERFRVTRREFKVSRDKRTLDWTVSAEERAYMDLPPGCTNARGTYSVKPIKTGPGLATWLCSLKATYTVRRDMPRRIAWYSFLALMRLRMLESRHCRTTYTPNIPQLPFEKSPKQVDAGNNTDAYEISKAVLNSSVDAGLFSSRSTQRPILLDFTVEEGLYLNSRDVSFGATWRINTTIHQILLASGLWRKLPYEDLQGRNLWAISMADVQGTSSWFTNQLDPSKDIIIDFGGPNAV